MRKLGVDAIVDQRAYERERDAFRREVIALKAIRRIPIGPVVTVVCENATTVRFQIQEMARAERMSTDEQIEIELATYNPLIPDIGEISMTLYLELTSEVQLREWLPRLTGIERSIILRVGAEGESITFAATVDPQHAAQLTREEITASVHYVRIALAPDAREQFLAGPAFLGIDHEAYQYETELTDATRASIGADWAE